MLIGHPTITCGVCQQPVAGLEEHKVLAKIVKESFEKVLDAVATVESRCPGSEEAAQVRAEFEKIRDSIPVQIEEMKQTMRSLPTLRSLPSSTAITARLDSITAQMEELKQTLLSLPSGNAQRSP